MDAISGMSDETQGEFVWCARWTLESDVVY